MLLPYDRRHTLLLFTLFLPMVSLAAPSNVPTMVERSDYEHERVLNLDQFEAWAQSEASRKAPDDTYLTAFLLESGEAVDKPAMQWVPLQSRHDDDIRETLTGLGLGSDSENQRGKESFDLWWGVPWMQSLGSAYAAEHSSDAKTMRLDAWSRAERRTAPWFLYGIIVLSIILLGAMVLRRQRSQARRNQRSIFSDSDAMPSPKRRRRVIRPSEPVHTP